MNKVYIDNLERENKELKVELSVWKSAESEKDNLKEQLHQT